MPLRHCFVCGGYVGCDCQDLSKIPDLFFRKMSDLIPAPVAKGDMPQVGLLKKKKKRLKSKLKEPGDDGGSDLESEQSCLARRLTSWRPLISSVPMAPVSLPPRSCRWPDGILLPSVFHCESMLPTGASRNVMLNPEQFTLGINLEEGLDRV